MNILLHICCSNCLTYPYKLLIDEGHRITGYWFNPNIHPEEEYNARLNSFNELVGRWDIPFYTEGYRPEEYFNLFTPGSIPKAPERCSSCYSLRLDRTARMAKEKGIDAFTTTLLISPYQDFERLVRAGNEIAQQYDIHFYSRDFRPHYNNSRVLSKELGLYKQKYCGCIYSKEEREIKRKDKKCLTHCKI
ncbi:MAG: epoxyqueuosine reductase QueH [Nitrospirae bacterium]|nr:epoxyqueuosine reductase QueH [Nitrospirota bacterium]